jgi:hypothetical protein
MSDLFCFRLSLLKRDMLVHFLFSARCSKMCWNFSVASMSINSKPCWLFRNYSGCLAKAAMPALSACSPSCHS